MALKIYNTLTLKKEAFKPIEKNVIKLYVCGVTVYGHCHIGHARSAIVFDVVYRYLLEKGYNVIFIKNFTDIDDKIIRRASEEGISWKEVGEKYIKSFYEDMDALHVLRPVHEPRATEHIEDMVRLVKTLLEKGYAYKVNGNVYFSVERYKKYGELSKRTLEEMLAGARVEIDERKKNPLDFALWKASKEGEPFWETPFGTGRPGWHIECSVMSTKYLNNPFDIHGGGKDLIFPHHENEKAQTEAATGKPFVNYWMHNGFVNMEKEKMSKSIGNIFLIKDFLKNHHPEALRLFFLSTHYRNPIDYNEQSLEDMHNALLRLYYTLERVSKLQPAKIIKPKRHIPADELFNRFYKAMDDDFNTALALSYIFELSKMLNRMIDEYDESAIPSIHYTQNLMVRLARILGLLNDDLQTFHHNETQRHLEAKGLDMETLEKMIHERTDARKNKNFKKADEIRNLLLEKGIMLLDTPAGTEWRIKYISPMKGEE